MSVAESGIAYVAVEWVPHGLSCMDCSTVFREGDRYTELLVAFAEDAPIVEIVCLDCAAARSPGR